MVFEIRDYDYLDNAPYDPTGAPWFDGDVIEFRRGSTLCGSSSFMDMDGKPSAMVLICTAPKRAWDAGNTDAWDTCIIFADRAGATAALRVARWLLRGDPTARLVIDGDICLSVGAQHAKQPCWRRLAKAVPERFPWNSPGDDRHSETRPRSVVGRENREARPEADAGRLARAGRAIPDGGR